MSELERVRRLPVFIDEEQWSRAYQAAEHEARCLLGELEDPGKIRLIATRIATAALRAAAQDDSGDVGDLPGVRVAQIANGTVKPNRYPSDQSRKMEAGDSIEFTGTIDLNL